MHISLRSGHGKGISGASIGECCQSEPTPQPPKLDDTNHHGNYPTITSASPTLPGIVTEIAVSPSTEVKAGDKLVTIEAMKMLTTVSAPVDGTIKEILVKKGIQVNSDDLLVVMA